MASLRGIRRKIKSVKSTQQITKAMNPPSLKLRRTGMAAAQDLPSIVRVQFQKECMHVGLNDGRTISVPVAWYPRLARAKRSQRMQFQILAAGHGIHWPELDEDLSLFGFLFPQGLVSFQEMQREA